ncbi:2-phosphosulfolactate phosphatase [Paenibacillus alkalitolerans]|uniref:2-phosphosulfolactate phosphatase n=1 Tax=Paenibacillus alkalitolerans TaxID=2799335 RepID=UPI0018F45780|nr:2-phosphosulfolactate phosphatase [Paenibacillus alkalitolerans]
MRIDCISNISETQAHDLAGKTVFVIDVLRATSTMVTALVHGSSCIVPVETVVQAKQTASEGDLLAGERQCKKIPGFHFGNSPHEFRTDAIAGKRIVMTTTNGTRGIQKAARGATVFAGSMLNASACAKAALRLRRDVVLLCAGTQDVFALEDGLCAGLITRELIQASGRELEMNDFAAAMAAAYAHIEHRLEEALLSCDGGVRLSQLGFADDVLYCSRVNCFDIVPVLGDGALRAFDR